MAPPELAKEEYNGRPIRQSSVREACHQRASTLGEALAKAERFYRENQEREQQAAQQEAEEEASWNARQEREAQRQSAKERLFQAVVASDPAALMLIKLFSEIVKDREFFEEQLASANDSAYYLEDFYASKLDQVRRQAAAEAQAEEARLQADRERWDREEAEEKLKKAKRTASYY